MSSTSPASARPGTVSGAFIAWLLAVLVGLITAVVFFVSAGVSVAAGESTLTADFFGITYVFAGILILVLTVIQGATAPRIRAGRNWARVVLTVLAVLQIVNAAFSMALNPLLMTALIVLNVVAVVLCWLPASNTFFGRQPTVAP